MSGRKVRELELGVGLVGGRAGEVWMQGMRWRRGRMVERWK